MNAREEKTNFKPLGRYPTKEVLKVFGFHRNTLRNYINAGYISPLPRKINRKENMFLGRDLNKLSELIY